MDTAAAARDTKFAYDWVDAVLMMSGILVGLAVRPMLGLEPMPGRALWLGLVLAGPLARRAMGKGPKRRMRSAVTAGGTAGAALMIFGMLGVVVMAWAFDNRLTHSRRDLVTKARAERVLASAPPICDSFNQPANCVDSRSPETEAALADARLQLSLVREPRQVLTPNALTLIAAFAAMFIVGALIDSRRYKAMAADA